MLARHSSKTGKIYSSLAFAKIFTRDLFVVSLTYKAQLSAIEKHLDEHRKFLQQHYQEHTFIASGPKSPREGGVIIATSPSRGRLEQILQSDPFWREGLAYYDITEFYPSMHSEDFAAIAERDVVKYPS